ncbi:MAG TPA: alpha/beta hydrolase-fold protein [Terriglobales bacterium]|nr:alpha/beta hydrolase-fold protein [Terriglobales bacterium]
MANQFPNAQLSRLIPGNESLRFLNFRGEALGSRGDVLLFTPPSMESLKGVPLLLLLHGVFGCQWNWWLNGSIDTIATEMLREGTTLPMMIAMPSDGLWGDGSGYVPHAHADCEKWIVDDIPRCLRELFPQLHQEQFLIAGLSMGGFGALRLGMKYASQVQGISAHSSVTKVEQLSQFIPFPVKAFQYAGDIDTDLLHWAKVNHDRLPPIRFDCGNEDSLIDANRELHAALLQLHVPHTYEEFPGGHDWPYWTEHVRSTLAFCKQVLSA